MIAERNTQGRGIAPAGREGALSSGRVRTSKFSAKTGKKESGVAPLSQGRQERTKKNIPRERSLLEIERPLGPWAGPRVKGLVRSY